MGLHEFRKVRSSQAGSRCAMEHKGSCWWALATIQTSLQGDSKPGHPPRTGLPSPTAHVAARCARYAKPPLAPYPPPHPPCDTARYPIPEAPSRPHPQSPPHLQRGLQLAIRHVPHAHCLVPAAAGETPAVGAECHTSDRLCVALPPNTKFAICRGGRSVADGGWMATACGCTVEGWAGACRDAGSTDAPATDWPRTQHAAAQQGPITQSTKCDAPSNVKGRHERDSP